MRGKIKFSQLSLNSMLHLTTTGLEAPMLKPADRQSFLYQLLIDSSYKVHINMEKTKNILRNWRGNVTMPYLKTEGSGSAE